MGALTMSPAKPAAYGLPLKFAAAATAVLMLAAARPAVPVVPVAAPLPAPAASTPSVRAGVERWRAGDYPGAVAIWQPFAAAGDADALFNMGQAYKLGRGVTLDAVVARDYYRKAAMKGHLPAQANLGIALFQAGEKPESIRWLKIAADRGEARAQYVLGIAAFNGDGLPRSQGLGYGYLLRAQASGLPQATTALGSIAPGLSPSDRTIGQSVAAGLAAGTGVPQALAAATGPHLITSPQPPIVFGIKPSVAVPLPPPIRSSQSPAVQADSTRALNLHPPVVAHAISPPAFVADATRSPNVAPAAAAPSTVAAVASNVAPNVAPNLAPSGRAAPAGVQAEAPVRPAPVQIATVTVPASHLQDAVAPPPPSAPPPSAVASSAAPRPAAVKPAPKPVAVAALKPFESIIPDRPVAKKPDGWRVQLGAFSQRKLADAAWAAAKADAGGGKPIFDTDGPIVKLQLGPYATRDAARGACAKLAEAGRSCFVTSG
ncbi:MAG: SPOR domain-containing protein [Janthinobacterium lividum]